MNRPVYLGNNTGAVAAETAGAPLAYPPSGWNAELSLRFARIQKRTTLVRRSHSGPLLVQKPLYPEGDAVCHTLIVHPPGGIAGGDQLRLNVALDDEAHALLSTPGAGKWYKANNARASQQLAFAVGQGGLLEWLPQETIVFDAASARLCTSVELAVDARYAGWEILCLGRRASGERFERGEIRQRTQLFRDGHLLWSEHMALRGGDPLLQSPVGLRGHTVTATFLIAHGAMPRDLLEQCRVVAADDGAACGVTALPEVFAARYLGDSAQHARRYFEKIWSVARPWYASRPAQPLRIWST